MGSLEMGLRPMFLKAVDQTNDAATNEIQFSAPVISKRQATTQIFLRDGQTTVIGGLAGNNSTKTTSGVPILSRIPFIGSYFFGNTTRTTTTNELFLFLTPHIISSDEDIERFRLPLPHRDMLPVTVEEKLICWADKFYSKWPASITEEKTVDKTRVLVAKYGEASLKRFDEWQEMFG